MCADLSYIKMGNLLQSLLPTTCMHLCDQYICNKEPRRRRHGSLGRPDGAMSLPKCPAEAKLDAFETECEKERLGTEICFWSIGAAKKGDLAEVRRLIAAGGDMESKVRSMTPLMLSAKHGRLELVRLLIDQGAYLEAKDKYGGFQTPLMHAVVGGHLDVARLLLSKGADADAVAMGVGVSSLNGKLERRTGWRMKEWTPLVYAAEEGHVEMARLLVSYGAQLGTPLRSAAQQGHVLLARLLISKGADVNAETKDGETPLMCAVKKRQLEAARLLISEGAKLDVARNDGETALSLAHGLYYRKIEALLTA